MSDHQMLKIDSEFRGKTTTSTTLFLMEQSCTKPCVSNKVMKITHRLSSGYFMSKALLPLVYRERRGWGGGEDGRGGEESGRGGGDEEGQTGGEECRGG